MIQFMQVSYLKLTTHSVPRGRHFHAAAAAECRASRRHRHFLHCSMTSRRHCCTCLHGSSVGRPSPAAVAQSRVSLCVFSAAAHRLCTKRQGHLQQLTNNATIIIIITHVTLLTGIWNKVQRQS